jgi:hypothetical protein
LVCGCAGSVWPWGGREHPGRWPQGAHPGNAAHGRVTQTSGNYSLAARLSRRLLIAYLMRDLIAQLPFLRARVSDSTLLDWLDLEQLLPERPCHIETDVLRRHWFCTQPSVSRRMTRLWEAGLLDYRAGGGLYRIRRLGLIGADRHAPFITQTRCVAVSLPPAVHLLTPNCDAM